MLFTMQHLLDLQIQPTYQYGTWVQHAGVSAASAEIAQWMGQGGQLWLSSHNSAGKTHLLHTLQLEHPDAAFLDIKHAMSTPSVTAQVQNFSEKLSNHSAWIIDIEAGALDFYHDSALFHLIAKATDQHIPLLLAWRCAATELALSQITLFLQQMTYVAMHAPETEEDKCAVLFSVAESRQWFMSEAVLALLYKQGIVALPALITVMEELHLASLQERRKMSLRWITQYFKRLKQK